MKHLIKWTILQPLPPSTPTHIPYSFWGVENTMQLVIREAGIDTLIGQII